MGGPETASWAKSVYSPYEDPGPAPEGFVDVLGLPYYGPFNGRDIDGEYFSPMTDTLEELFPFPPVAYVHGTADEDKEYLGETVRRWDTAAGEMFRLMLDPNSSRYNQLIEAKAQGKLYASTGAVQAFSKAGANGHIDQWLVGEISLVDLRDGYRPRNPYAMAKAMPELDALFRDYYGNPVLEKDPTVREMLSNFLTWIREKLSAEIATGALELPVEEKQEIIEEVIESSLEEIAVSDSEDQKCMACDAADELKAELEDMMKPGKCERCPGLIAEIKSFVKAGKLSPREAYKVIDQFTVSDDGWDEFAAKVNEKPVLASLIKAAPKTEDTFIAGGQTVVTEKTVDQDFVTKMVNSAQPVVIRKGRE